MATDADRPPPLPSTFGDRLASVDVLRALDILLMIFVNDLAATPDAPAWLLHIKPPDADGMTVADVVFPGFLFIAGMSIPLAFERALARNSSRLWLLPHVLGRWLSLLILGVLMVNPPPTAGFSNPAAGEALLYFAMILTWIAPASKVTAAVVVQWAVRLAGASTLIYLAATYRYPDGSWLRTEWWGILGLIGWAYLLAALVYLAFGRHRELIVGAGALLLTVYLGREAGILGRIESKPWLDFAKPALGILADGLNRVDSIVSLSQTLGSLASITVLGMTLGSILVPGIGIPSHADRLRWAATFGAGLSAAAILLDTFHGINKIAATPAWCLWCSALTCWTWLLISWWLDAGGRRPWSLLLGVGANPLLAYLLHPLLLNALDLMGVNAHHRLSGAGASAGLARSAVMTLTVAMLTAALTRAGLRLRL
jgi:heparan-alpha-glucosaminide N-acetyltransferase